MKFENAEVFNFYGAFRGMRNPLESWDKSDSGVKCDNDCVDCPFSPEWNGNKPLYIIGEHDMQLAQKLIKGGPPHSKFLRQIFVTIDITAPLYWWKEMDTYKISTTANSTSTMHKLASTPITKECFEMDDYNNLLMYNKEPYEIDNYTDDIWDEIICHCETLRKRYLETKDIKYWKELIRLLPESWLQTRTWTADYEVLRNIVHWRSKHKLTEWHQFVDFIKTLPYAKQLIFYNNDAE